MKKEFKGHITELPVVVLHILHQSLMYLLVSQVSFFLQPSDSTIILFHYSQQLVLSNFQRQHMVQKNVHRCYIGLATVDLPAVSQNICSTVPTETIWHLIPMWT